MENKNEIKKYYKKILKSVYDFMVENGYANKGYPKVVLRFEEPIDIFSPTAYFDPETKKINLFITNRWCKDVVRSFCHECIHKKQDEDGVIAKSGYSSDKITEDKNLIRLESEAYLKGNMAFRSWTEVEKKKGLLK